MSENNSPSLIGEALFRMIREAVRLELQCLQTESKDEDRLVSVEEAAELLGVSRDWLYRRASKLPFTRKLGPKMLRFSSIGIQKYLATRKIT
jgi:excisionase family DNA binding protein